MPESKGRQTLNVDLGGLKPRLLQEAERLGKRPAALVREAVAMALQEHAADAVALPPSTRASPRRGAERWVTATYRLSASEAEALRVGAAIEGVSQAEHVGRLALAHDAGVSRLQVLDALQALTGRLQSLELVLQAAAHRQPGPDLAALLDQGLREVRVQAKQASGMVQALVTTRRDDARRRKS
jgi:hypothetical protein